MNRLKFNVCKSGKYFYIVAHYGNSDGYVDEDEVLADLIGMNHYDYKIMMVNKFKANYYYNCVFFNREEDAEEAKTYLESVVILDTLSGRV